MSIVTTTYLEMRSPHELRPKGCTDERFWIGECTVKQWPFNRFLYLAVGGPWAWTDQRGWTEEQWRAYAESDRLRTFAAYYDGSPTGYYELHRGDGSEIEIAYFGLAPPSPQQRVAHTMASLNCSACHERDGVGGVKSERDAFFTSNGEDLGDEGRLPPRLDGVGDKLRPGWLSNVLAQGVSVRSYFNTRMPQFGAANVWHLTDLFVGLDRRPHSISPEPDTVEVQRDVGRRLTGTEGLSCIECHRFNRQPAHTLQVIDLATTTERLNEDWFRQFPLDPNRFHPGTRMPSLWPDGKALLPDTLGGNTDRQHAALWMYLADGSRANFPDGLSRQNMELIVGGEAVVYRGKLWEAGFRAVAVGYPGQMNVAFDAEEMRLALLWRGRFLNAGPHWGVQGMGQIHPLGSDIVVLPHGFEFAVLTDASAPWPTEPSKTSGMKFRGYQLDGLKRPALLYSFRDVGVEDFVTPSEATGEAGLRRALNFTDPPPEGLHFRVAVGKLTPASDSTWRLDNFTLPVDAMTAGDPSSYSLETFTHHFYGAYGGPEIEQADQRIASAIPSAEGSRRPSRGGQTGARPHPRVASSRSPGSERAAFAA